MKTGSFFAFHFETLCRLPRIPQRGAGQAGAIGIWNLKSRIVSTCVRSVTALYLFPKDGSCLAGRQGERG